jgi:hypothetical protein
MNWTVEVRILMIGGKATAHRWLITWADGRRMFCWSKAPSHRGCTWHAAGLVINFAARKPDAIDAEFVLTWLEVETGRRFRGRRWIAAPAWSAAR